MRGDVSKAARRDEGAARNVLPVCCEAPRHGGWSTGPKTAEGIEHPAGCNGKHGRRTKAAEAERAEFQRLVREAWEMLKRLRGLLSLSACQVRRSACQSHFRMQFLLQAAPKFQLLRPRPRRRDRPDGALAPWGICRRIPADTASSFITWLSRWAVTPSAADLVSSTAQMPDPSDFRFRPERMLRPSSRRSSLFTRLQRPIHWARPVRCHGPGGVRAASGKVAFQRGARSKTQHAGS